MRIVARAFLRLGFFHFALCRTHGWGSAAQVGLRGNSRQLRSCAGAPKACYTSKTVAINTIGRRLPILRAAVIFSKIYE